MGEKGFVILGTSHSTGGKPKTADTEKDRGGSNRYMHNSETDSTREI